MKSLSYDDQQNGDRQEAKMKAHRAKGLVALQGQRPARRFQGASEKCAIQEGTTQRRWCSTGHRGPAASLACQRCTAVPLEGKPPPPPRVADEGMRRPPKEGGGLDRGGPRIKERALRASGGHARGPGGSVPRSGDARPWRCGRVTPRFLSQVCKLKIKGQSETPLKSKRAFI